ncbi:MAG: hypothetical protein LBI86_06400 [Treponema sp.]|jgi:hypothetical protein|nr:hypothetical protein [Treponema sp.]
MKPLKSSSVFFVFFPFCSALFFFACISFPPQWYGTESWSTSKDPRNLPSIWIAEVSVDLTGVWTAVENEITGLAPLVFWEQGFAAVRAGEAADYEADIWLREREFISGWKTRRSLAAEVRIWKAGERGGKNIPLAAGRVTTAGDESFSSSKTAGRMLAIAAGKAAAALREGEEKK